jgi:hypothetical protein
VTSQTAPRPRWLHQLGALLFVLFCFELGLMLLTLPWMDSWELNWFATLSPAAHGLWTNSYFRGAVSGIGAFNIFIAISEARRMLRRA